MANILQTLEAICIQNGATPDHWEYVSSNLSARNSQIEPFFAYLKSKLEQANLKSQLLLLDLVDYVSDKGTMPIWTEMSTKSFLSTVISILKKTNDAECHSKILFLIQKWAKKYEKYKDLLPNFNELYTKLLKSKVEFSSEQLLTYQVYTEPQKDSKRKERDAEDNDFSYTEVVKIRLNSIKLDEQNAKLYNYLGTMVESVALGNEIIDNTANGEKVEPSLQDIFDFLPKANQCLIQLISSEKLHDEQLTEFLLGVIEDVNRTISRVEAVKAKAKPDPFLSFFTENLARKGEMPLKKSFRMDPYRQSLLQSQIKIDSSINCANDFFDFHSNKQNAQPQVKAPQSNNKPVPYKNQMGEMSQNCQQQVNSVPLAVNNPLSFNEDLLEIFAPPQVVLPKDPKLWGATDILSDQLKNVYPVPPQQNYEQRTEALAKPQEQQPLQLQFENKNLNSMPMPMPMNQPQSQFYPQLSPNSQQYQNQQQFNQVPQLQNGYSQPIQPQQPMQAQYKLNQPGLPHQGQYPQPMMNEMPAQSQPQLQWNMQQTHPNQRFSNNPLFNPNMQASLDQNPLIFPDKH